MGPVFIHEQPCEPSFDIEAVKTLVRSRLLVLRGYDVEDNLVEGVVTPGSDFESVAETLFEQSAIQRLHAFNAKAGCFLFEVNRTQPDPTGPLAPEARLHNK